MAGLVPAIHAFVFPDAVKTWMPATGAGMTRRENFINTLLAIVARLP
jgi:hypothetical protein